MKITAFLVSLFIACAAWAAGTSEPKPVLAKGDVEKFIKTFPNLVKEFKKFGAKYDNELGGLSFPDGMKASAEMLAILKKNGWDARYFMKSAVIAMAFTSIVYKKQMKNVDPEFEKALTEIDNNPDLSPEMKKQMKDQINASRGATKDADTQMGMAVSTKDLEMVRPHVKKLKAIFESIK